MLLGPKRPRIILLPLIIKCTEKYKPAIRETPSQALERNHLILS